METQRCNVFVITGNDVDWITKITRRYSIFDIQIMLRFYLRIFLVKQDIHTMQSIKLFYN